MSSISQTPIFIQTSLLSFLLLFLSFLLSKFHKMKQTHPLVYIYVCVCVCVELPNIFPFFSERDLLLNLLMKSKIFFFSPKLIENNIHLRLNGVMTSSFFFWITHTRYSEHSLLWTILNFSILSVPHKTMYPIYIISHSHPHKHFNMHNILSVMGKQEQGKHQNWIWFAKLGAKWT